MVADNDELRGAVERLEGPAYGIVDALAAYRDRDRMRPDAELDADLDEATERYEQATREVGIALDQHDGADAWSRRAGLAFLDYTVAQEAACSIRFQEGLPVTPSNARESLGDLISQVGGRQAPEEGEGPVLPRAVEKAISDIVEQCSKDLVEIAVATAAPVGLGVSGLLQNWPAIGDLGQRVGGAGLNVLRRFVSRMARSFMERMRDLAGRIPDEVLQTVRELADRLGVHGLETARENIATEALNRLLHTEQLNHDLNRVLAGRSSATRLAAGEAALKASTAHKGGRKWLPAITVGLGAVTGITVPLAGMSMPLWVILSAGLVIYSLLLAVDYLDTIRPGLFVGVRLGVEDAVRLA